MEAMRNIETFHLGQLRQTIRAHRARMEKCRQPALRCFQAKVD
jgi:hypothetical protein